LNFRFIVFRKEEIEKISVFGFSDCRKNIDSLSSEIQLARRKKVTGFNIYFQINFPHTNKLGNSIFTKGRFKKNKRECRKMLSGTLVVFSFGV